MKKEIFVLFINGSPRKNGKTAKYLKEIEKGAKKEKAKTKILHLIDFKILPCLGCYSLSPKNCTFPCKQKDDMEKIYPLLLKAKGIVVGSPSYWFSATGLVKNFVDRLTCLENNGYLLEEKVFATVSSAQESGGDEVSHYLISVFNEMGCIIPPFASPFFDESESKSWQKKELEILGRNIVRLAKVLKKAKLL
ncbi:flavodoxin family protein [Candidatus Parcubacteria bacterium]|nr:flavodoxin family protein [Candidatus Parcubacteria bacterium]